MVGHACRAGLRGSPRLVCMVCIKIGGDSQLNIAQVRLAAESPLTAVLMSPQTSSTGYQLPRKGGFTALESGTEVPHSMFAGPRTSAFGSCHLLHSQYRLKLKPRSQHKSIDDCLNSSGPRITGIGYSLSYEKKPPSLLWAQIHERGLTFLTRDGRLQSRPASGGPSLRFLLARS